jgi:hypothetical protein
MWAVVSKLDSPNITAFINKPPADHSLNQMRPYSRQAKTAAA